MTVEEIVTYNALAKAVHSASPDERFRALKQLRDYLDIVIAKREAFKND